MSAHERTGWRDKDLSGRHRDWGVNCPMSDLDFIGTEYDKKEPVALIDYKLRQNPYEPLPPTMRLLQDANLYVLGRLGALAQIPSFVVFYGNRFAWFQVQGLNKIGAGRTPEVQPMSEKDYVRFLYELRGRELPEEVGDHLVDETVAYIQEHYNEEMSMFDDWPKGGRMSLSVTTQHGIVTENKDAPGLDSRSHQNPTKLERTGDWV